MIAEKESGIQSAICDYLELNRHFFWRQNTAPAFDWKTKQFRKMPKHAMRGIPDIILVQQGLFVGLEVKSAIGKQSEDQKAFEKNLKDAGGRYYVVRSIEDVQKLGL